MKKIIKVEWTEIVLFEQNEQDYISLTDIAKQKWDKPDMIIQNWIRNNSTIQFLWLWEKENNPNFNPFTFEGFKNKSAENSFVMTPKKWIENTNAIWIVSKAWRYGWTYAHKYIAFEFASWISAEFKYFLVKEFDRLKSEENERKLLWWDIKRTIASMNYKVQTDAIQLHLIPTLPEFKKKYIYANEADLINLVIFWKTAKEWKEENPELAKNWNMRDYANVVELVVLANLESFNADYIKQWLTKEERFEKLSQISKTQKISLLKQYWETKKLN